MTVLPQKYGKWSMVIFQIMVEPFLQAKFQILSKHSFCYTSSFNPKGNQRVPQALPLLRIQSKPDSMKFILSLNLMTNQRGDTFDRTSCSNSCATLFSDNQPVKLLRTCNNHAGSTVFNLQLTFSSFVNHFKMLLTKITMFFVHSTFQVSSSPFSTGRINNGQVLPEMYHQAYNSHS